MDNGIDMEAIEKLLDEKLADSMLPLEDEHGDKEERDSETDK